MSISEGAWDFSLDCPGLDHRLTLRVLVHLGASDTIVPSFKRSHDDEADRA
jgi:hypothetical protein